MIYTDMGVVGNWHIFDRLPKEIREHINNNDELFPSRELDMVESMLKDGMSTKEVIRLLEL